MNEIILQTLLRPQAYDDLPRSVTMKQTHISYIFITDSYVYKVKKPVDFGFLNFTTIDRRRFYCEEEVRLNRRLSPDVYLGVVELREVPGGASFTGDGQVIDYAVKMRRLPEELMLDKLIDEGMADAHTMLRIASTVAGFHLSAETGEAIKLFGTIDAIRRNWDENFRLAERFTGLSLAAEDLSFLRDWMNRFTTEHAGLFESRMEGGFIRDCDGDLHLANICVGESVWIFDCIEFNDRFRYLDTASDIAFLVMDLEYHDRSDLAQVFLDEYCRLTGDSDCLPLVRFYKVYRAFVRGKIASLAMQDPAMSPSERHASRETAISYFRLARGYLLRDRLPQTLIMIGGMIGSGKTTVARHLGRELGLPVLSSDRVRKELFLSEGGSGQYTAEADSTTYDELFSRAMNLLAIGESLIVDATFRRKTDRDRFRHGAEAAGVTVCLAVTDAPEEVIVRRLADRKEKPDRYSDAGTEIYPFMRASFEWPESPDEQYVSAPTSGSATAAVDDILRHLTVLS